MATIADFHIHGFDISSYQTSAPNFAQGGRQFAIFKATEGLTYFDPHFLANRSAAHVQSMTAIGLYHFAHSTNNAVSEANYFLQHVGKPQPGEFAILDYETGGWNSAWINQWGSTVRAAGWKTVVYTYLGMLGSYDPNSFNGGLWVADYVNTAPSIHWTFWQHTDGAGQSPSWDCSVFYDNNITTLQNWVGVPVINNEDDDDMPTVRIPGVTINSPKDASGRSYEKGTIATVPGTIGLISVSADGFPAVAPTVRIAIGSGRADGVWKHKHPDAGIHDNVYIANWPANYGYNHSTPFGVGFDEEASVVNYGASDVTLTAIAGK